MKVAIGVAKFRASTGNEADLRGVRINGRIAIDVRWNRTPTAEEIAECDKWAEVQVAAGVFTGKPTQVIFDASKYVETEAERRRVIDKFLAGDESK